jgi:hypothetical protein
VRIVAANPLHQFVLPHHRRKPTRSARPTPPIVMATPMRFNQDGSA